ncbi:sensor histidine kinase [Oryzobacter sp. R7]|uniref:sensor histidine kinase n=1 Tax=Oryzobacter faecalis TaxID=3388656 RepID=UPI00398C99EA
MARTAAEGDARTVGALTLFPGADVPADGGPALVLPLLGDRDSVVVALRPPGAPPFSGPELEMGSTFARQVSMALELARAREDQQRVALLEDRTRIARDLHDHVIQQMFAAGLAVQGDASTLGDEGRAAALAGVVDTLDDAVRQVRDSIFRLRVTPREQAGLRARVAGVADELRDALGYEPRVTFSGPVDAAVGDGLAEDVVAVVREGLANVARHAASGSALVRVEVDGARVVVEVVDDGRGPSATGRSSGLANLAERAVRQGGSAVLDAGPEGRGSVLRWSAPLR